MHCALPQHNTSVAKATEVLRKLGCCLQIEVAIVYSLCRNSRHQVILFGDKVRSSNVT